MATTTKRKPKGKAETEAKAEGDPVAIPSFAPVDAPEARLIDVERILVRGKHDRDLKSPAEKAAVDALAESIRARGLLQPIKVVVAVGVVQAGGSFELVYGERRLAAARLLGWKQIPAFIGDRATLEADRVVENAQREDPNPIQQAVAVADAFDVHREQELKERGWTDNGELHPADLKAVRTGAAQRTARALGKPVQWVYDRLFLGDLDSKTRQLVVEGKLPMESARELAAVADPETRAEMAVRFAGNPAREVEPTRLSEVRLQVGKVVRLLSKVPWDLSIPFANAPACDRCPKNSRNIAGLFDGKVTVGERWHTKQVEAPEEGVCTDQACFGRKQGTVNRQIATAAQRLVKAELTVSAKGKEAKEAAVSKGSIEVPAHAKADSFKREARARAKDKLGQTPAAAGSSGSRPAKRAETPETVAAKSLLREEGKWREKVKAEMNKKLKGDNVRLALLDLFMGCDAVEGVEGSNEYQRRPEPTPAKLKAFDAALDLLKLPPGEAMVALASLPVEYPRHVHLGYMRPAHVERLCAIMGLDKLPPKPTLDQFLKPAAKGEAKPPKGKKPKGGEKPAKASPDGYGDESIENDGGMADAGDE